MSSHKHTPGPWRLHTHYYPISQHYGYGIVTDEEYGDVLGSTETNPRYPEAKANAQLMAAAPDLLAVAESLLKEFWLHTELTRDEFDLEPMVIAARRAIAAATGSAENEHD